MGSSNHPRGQHTYMHVECVRELRELHRKGKQIISLILFSFQRVSSLLLQLHALSIRIQWHATCLFFFFFLNHSSTFSKPWNSAVSHPGDRESISALNCYLTDRMIHTSFISSDDRTSQVNKLLGGENTSMIDLALLQPSQGTPPSASPGKPQSQVVFMHIHCQ